MAAAAAGLGFSEWTTTARPYMDARFQEILGVAPEQLDEARVLWLSRIHDEDRPKLEDASRRLMAAEADHIVMEYRYRHPQRGETWLRHSTCRVPLERSDECPADWGPRGHHREETPRGTPPAAERGPRKGERHAPGRGGRRLTPGHIVGRSAAIRRPLALAEQVAATDSTALLLGETGTGKERFANYIHDCSRRRNRLMIVVNCSAIPTPLLESELFGREKGAYTGALSRQSRPVRTRPRLDAVPRRDRRTAAGSPGQAPAGAREPHHRAAREPEADSRSTSASSRPRIETWRRPSATAASGRTSYYRLNVFPIDVPPLRERRDDIPFAGPDVRRGVDAGPWGSASRRSIARSLDALADYAWPGNVRELRNAVERAMILATGPDLVHRGAAGDRLRIRAPHPRRRRPRRRSSRYCTRPVGGFAGRTAPPRALA